MKKMILIILVTIVCGCSEDPVRKMAIKYDVESPIKWLVEYYSRSYYKLPEQPEDLIEFIYECTESGYDHPVDSELSQLLKQKKIKMSSYPPDSVFLFFPPGKCGACIYGHPLYWIKNIDKWPKDKFDYLEQFLPAAFYNNGDFIFEISYREYEEKWDQLWNLCQVYLLPQVVENNDLFLFLEIDFDSRIVSLYDTSNWVPVDCPAAYVLFLETIVKEVIPPEKTVSRAILPIRNLSVRYINPAFEAYQTELNKVNNT